MARYKESAKFLKSIVNRNQTILSQLGLKEAPDEHLRIHIAKSLGVPLAAKNLGTRCVCNREVKFNETEMGIAHMNSCNKLCNAGGSRIHGHNMFALSLTQAIKKAGLPVRNENELEWRTLIVWDPKENKWKEERRRNDLAYMAPNGVICEGDVTTPSATAPSYVKSVAKNGLKVLADRASKLKEAKHGGHTINRGRKFLPIVISDKGEIISKTQWLNDLSEYAMSALPTLYQHDKAFSTALRTLFYHRAATRSYMIYRNAILLLYAQRKVSIAAPVAQSNPNPGAGEQG